MGADHPGDIKYLTSIFTPDMAVVLTVLPVHMADFKNIQAIAAEKSELVKAVKTRGKVFLNSDDKLVAEMARGAKGQIIYFGSKEGANYQFQKASSTLNGLEFDLLIEGKRDHFKVRLYGEHMIYPIVAAIAVAHEAGITVQRIKEGLREITPYKGRMNILEGVKDSIIIDDTYNANPRSMIGALEFLSMQKGRKIALLGNMNELGDFEREGHEMVGRKVAEVADMLVTVGELAKKYIAAEAEKSGLAPEKIISFTDSKEAGKWLKKRLREGDIILAKGSQNKVRMERAVEEILKNPKEARKVLVRQSAFWKERV
jgi:UDP-N-acetylmuramoyl-tripeptide--D-alanyl-D-alanine ligase